MSLTERLKANLSRKGEPQGRLKIREVANAADEFAAAENLGAALRAARRRQSIDVEQVAAELKIRDKHLRALEDNDFEALPSLPYALGFVRSYADYLGLDAVQCLRQFKEEHPARPDKKKLNFPEARDEVRLPQGSMFVLAVLLGVGIYGGWYLSVQADRMVMSRVPPVPERLVEQTGSGDEDQLPIGTSDVAQGSTHDQAIGGPAFQVSSAPERTSLSLGQAAADEDSRSLTILPRRNPSLDRDVTEFAASDPRVVLRAQAAAWIRVEDSESRVLIQRELAIGERYSVPNRPGLILSVRDAGALEVIVDGLAIGPLGDAGQPLPAVSLDPLSLKSKRAS